MSNVGSAGQRPLIADRALDIFGRLRGGLTGPLVQGLPGLGQAAPDTELPGLSRLPRASTTRDPVAITDQRDHCAADKPGADNLASRHLSDSARSFEVS
jgi:hypothetical protein